MECYNFSLDIEHHIQLHELKRSFKEANYNQHFIEEFFRKQCDKENQKKNNIKQHLGEPLKKLFIMFDEHGGQGNAMKQPNIPNEFCAHYMQIVKNLKQRLTDAIKERNSNRSLDEQVAILDSMRESLAEDPLKVLSWIGYQAIIKNDEFNIPKTSKNFCPEFVQRYERKRQELAETFCLLQFSGDVIKSCDEYDVDFRVYGKRLYEK